MEFLMKLFVVKTLHISINTTDDIKDNTNNDDQTWTRDEKIDLRRSWEEIEICIYLGHKIWENCDKSKKSSTPKIEPIRNMLEIFGCFFSWTNSWDISTSLLYILGDICRIECNRNIEECKAKDKCKIRNDVDPAWVLHREIGREPLTDSDRHTCSSFGKDLSDQWRECDNRDSEDNRYHTCLIHSDREIWSLISSSTSIDKGYLAISLCESHYNIYDTNCKNGYKEKESIVLCRNIVEDMLWHSCEDTCKDDDRCTVTDTSLRDEITEPEEDHRTSSNIGHSGEYYSPEVSRIDDRSSTSCSDNRIEEEDHTIALSKCKRNGEISSIVIELFLSLFTLFFEGIQRGHYHSQELYNDGRIDIWSKTHEYDRELLETTTHDRTKERKLRIGSELFRECGEECYIDPWDWYRREQLVDCNHQNGKYNFLANMLGCPDFLEIGYHNVDIKNTHEQGISREKQLYCRERGQEIKSKL